MSNRAETLPCGISKIKIDKTNRYALLYASDTYYKIRGYTPQEFEEQFNHDTYETIAPDSLTQFSAVINTALETENRAIDYELIILRKDGDSRHLLCRGVFVKEVSDGWILSTVEVDITDAVKFR